MRSKVLLIVAFLIFPLGKSLQSQTDVSNAQAVFIYNFLSHVKWPDNAVGSKYTIGVLGSTPTFKYLKSYTANRKVGSKSIEVIQYRNLADVPNLHVLFVAFGKCKEMQAIENKMSGKPCLIIGEKAGTTETGASIDFNIVNNKLRYKINKVNVEKHNLYVSAALLQMSM